MAGLGIRAQLPSKNEKMLPPVETELKFFTLKNKIFGIMESLLYQNLYKTKKTLPT
jgi:hypothetical protein